MSRASWRRPIIEQWGWMLAALIIAIFLSRGFGALWRMDLSFYDAALPTGAAPVDVVIVAIDDASIAALGRWPWRRELHAALLDRLRSMGARAVALDLLLTEPDSEAPQGDIALADAMRRGPPTVLPLFVEMPGPGRRMQEHLPIPLFAQAAAAIGHAHLELDRDGVARSVFLREGMGVPHWPHFAVAMLDSIGNGKALVLRGVRHPDLAHASPDSWVRDHQIRIPFLGPPGLFTRVSYVDVLRGAVAGSAIRGKLVLVGATAQGVGDAYPTPRSGEGVAMSGVEITANVLQALRAGTDIKPLPNWAVSLVALAPIGAAGIALLLLAPWQALLAVLGLALCTIGASVFALCSGWWWPPSEALVGLAVVYPLWSWRRLAVTQVFLEEEFTLLAAERLPLFGSSQKLATNLAPMDFVERRIELLRQATQRLSDVRRLFSDTVSNLPDATVLVDESGRIALANHAAAQLFAVAAPRDIEETSLDSHLYAQVRMDHARFAALAAGAPMTVEAALRNSKRHVLIRAVPFSGAGGERIGTIIALADITELRTAQAERDDLLRFLSHDMKSPASSLLGLAQLQRDPNRALPSTDLSARLEVLAQRLLTLVDGFTALVRAESTDSSDFEPFDLCDAIKDAYDEVWASAQARGSSINTALPEDPLMIEGDRQLLARAVVNLFSNALKFSAPGAAIDLHCARRGNEALIEVADHGPGVATDDAALLFKRFSRGLHRGATDPGGAGLGLAFVRVVAEKHGGRAWMESRDGYGAIFCLSIAAVAAVY